MIENNPDKIKEAEIVVGIPSLNEADNIAFITDKIDQGLIKYFSGQKAVIVNSDNNSPDNTGRVFLRTKTKNPKIYISTSGGQRGKGNNLKNLFLKIKDLGAKTAMTVDADIKSISAQWIKCFLEPISRGYDFIAPVYRRHKYDGSITNHLTYPLIYGLLGYDFRQPIGGDMSFSSRMVDYWIEQKWPPAASGYGIDIFMTSQAIKSGLKLGQVNLGSKFHKPSLLKLDNMFLEVAETFFNFLANHRNLWPKEINLKKLPLVCRVNGKIIYQKLPPVEYKEIEETALADFPDCYQNLKDELPSEISGPLRMMFLQKKSLKITADFWSKVVYQLFYLYQVKPEKDLIIKLLRSLYLGRMASAIKEEHLKNRKESEKLVQKQAQLFFKNRNYLLGMAKKTQGSLALEMN